MSAIDDLRKSLQTLKDSGNKINLRQIAIHADVAPSYLNKEEAKEVRNEILDAEKEWKRSKSIQDLEQELENTKNKLKKANNKIKKLEEISSSDQQDIIEVLIKKLDELYNENDKLKKDLKIERENNSTEQTEEIRFDEETGEIISGVKFK